MNESESITETVSFLTTEQLEAVVAYVNMVIEENRETIRAEAYDAGYNEGKVQGWKSGYTDGWEDGNDQ